MPLYEYECPHCGHEFEYVRPMSECDKAAECPQCGKNARKVFRHAPAGYVFGGGETFEHEDGTPRKIGSRAELQAVLQKTADTEETYVRNPYYGVESK